MTARRWILHLPTTLTSLDEAAALTERLRAVLADVAAIDFGAATLSDKDRVMVRHQVFCDTQLPDRLRCARRHEHHGPCDARPDLPDTVLNH
jgi:hypothetical protein